MNIIGYIHVCQIGQWQRSLNYLMESIRKSGLYEKTTRIRLGIVNDLGGIIPDAILKDSKFDIVCIGKSHEYERPTLLHMRKSAEIDQEGTVYYYLHTKGLRHFGYPQEPAVLDWIQLMLYWNIERHELALEKLKTYDTYGCNYNTQPSPHYSGNFWWAKREHMLLLPDVIGTTYNDPEFWVLNYNNITNNYTAFNSGVNHYHYTFPRSCYASSLT